MSTLLTLLLATTTTAPVPTPPPYTETAGDALAPVGLRHQEALRIDRDFGKPEFDLVVDTWTPERGPDTFAEVRLWWVKTTAGDRRSPLSTRAQKYVDIDARADGPDHWTLAVTGDHKRFAFDVELDAEGRAHVFTDVVVEGGERVDHCRALSGFLHARKILGVPVGIAKLSVTCVDDDGALVRGHAVIDRVRR
ncbi:MAG: hypothetical protein U0168_25440 [Nannocystaceae bacterium]